MYWEGVDGGSLVFSGSGYAVRLDVLVKDDVDLNEMKEKLEGALVHRGFTLVEWGYVGNGMTKFAFHGTWK
jgi:hypothetical protein